MVIAAAADAAAQARMELVPSVSFSTSYDDNIFTTQQGSGDTMMLVTPAFEGFYESPNTLLRGLYTWDMQRAFGFSTLNSLDAKRHGVVDTAFQLTPQFRLSLLGRYDVSDRPGDLVFDTGVLLGRQRARRYQITPAISIRVRPRTSLNIQYDATRESLRGDRDALDDGVLPGSGRVLIGGVGDLPVGDGDLLAGDEALLAGDGELPVSDRELLANGREPLEVGRELLDRDIDGRLYIARVGVSRSHTTRDAWSVSYLGRTFANGADMSHPALTERSHALLLGYSRALALGTTLSVQLGPRLSSYGNDKPEVTANFSRQLRAGKFGMDFWQGETIIMGIRGPVDITSFSFKSSWLLRRHLEVSAHAGVFNSVTLEQGRARVLHPEFVVSYSPGGPYVIAGSYGIDFQKGDVRSAFLSDREVVRHVLLFRLTYAPRLSRIKPRDPDDPRSKGGVR
jgi:hypothetical protein